MNRIAIFSHYSALNRIEDYVVYFLQELNKFASDIIFVSDCSLNENELHKINSFVSKSIIGKHGEYDFGSYKRGFQYALENNLLDNYEELIFVNDSCYAPITPFDEMFNKMSNKDIDFWGVTANFNSYFGKDRHIQSYFIAFKPQVFHSKKFIDFILSITKEKNKKVLIENYEIGLTNELERLGFKYDVYSSFSKTHYASHLLYYKDIVINDRIPFVKRSLPLLKSEVFPIGFKKFILKNVNYDYDLIQKDSINKSYMNLKRFLIFMYKFIIRSSIVLGRNLFVRLNYE